MGTMKVCCEDGGGLNAPMRDVEMMGRSMQFDRSTTAPTPMAGASNVDGMAGNRGFGFPVDSTGVHVPLPRTTPPPEKFFG